MVFNPDHCEKDLWNECEGELCESCQHKDPDAFTDKVSKWETVAFKEFGQISLATERMKVQGGWLVRDTMWARYPLPDFCDGGTQIQAVSVTTSFVPDQDHRWENFKMED